MMACKLDHQLWKWPLGAIRIFDAKLSTCMLTTLFFGFSLELPKDHPNLAVHKVGSSPSDFLDCAFLGSDFPTKTNPNADKTSSCWGMSPRKGHISEEIIPSKIPFTIEQEFLKMSADDLFIWWYYNFYASHMHWLSVSYVSRNIVHTKKTKKIIWWSV